MHETSLVLMDELLDRVHVAAGGRVLDVGARNVNGTYRELVERRGLRYCGLDGEHGPNVDVVADVYTMRCIGPAVVPDSFDLVLCGQVLEHLAHPFAAVLSMTSMLKLGGSLIAIAPSVWPLHRHPIDCWRVQPDGMEALLSPIFRRTETGARGPDTYGLGLERHAGAASTWSTRLQVLLQAYREVIGRGA